MSLKILAETAKLRNQCMFLPPELRTIAMAKSFDPNWEGYKEWQSLLQKKANIEREMTNFIGKSIQQEQPQSAA